MELATITRQNYKLGDDVGRLWVFMRNFVSSSDHLLQSGLQPSSRRYEQDAAKS